MIVGVISGTYSTVFIASSVAIILSGRSRRRRRPRPRAVDAPEPDRAGRRTAFVDLFAAVLLGAVQGITEFLPISSSAHLILVEAFFGWDAERFGLAFDVACHVGTLVAVLIFFSRDLVAHGQGGAPGSRSRVGP